MSGLFLMVDEKGNPIPSDSCEALREALTESIKEQADALLTSSSYDAALKAGPSSTPHLFDIKENSGRE